MRFVISTISFAVRLSLSSAQDEIDLCPTYPRPLVPQSTWGENAIRAEFVNWAGEPIILEVHEPGGNGLDRYAVYNQGDFNLVVALPGSVLRVVRNESQTLLFERMMVPHDGMMGSCSIFPCGKVSRAEYDALRVNSTCDESLPSKLWNCVRLAPPMEEWPREKYGFTPEEVEVVPESERFYGPYQTEADTEWDAPALTDDGFVLLKMPADVYEAAKTAYRIGLGEAAIEGDISGHYSNFYFQEKKGNAWTMANLDNFQNERAIISNGVRRILTWWAKAPLVHEATYGVRIYHRDAVLLNHRDVDTTHLISAVLQVDQNAEEGWPLLMEIQRDPIKYAEVYLQPGYMALYEGARLKHGRPSRFNGTDFAMVFTHNRPVKYYPDVKYEDPSGLEEL